MGDFSNVSDPRHVLALVPNWLGDAAMCTPALRALHRRFPGAALTVVGRESVCDLLRDTPWIKGFFPVGPRAGALDMARAAWALRPVDIAVIFPHSFRAALFARITGARRRVGYGRNGRGLLLTDRICPHFVNGKLQPVYMAREYLDLVKCLGCDDDGLGLELATDPAAVESVRACLPVKGPRVGIAAGAAFGPSKRWPAERYARVADALAEQSNAHCVLITGPGEEDLRDAVLAEAKSPLFCLDRHFQGIRYLKAAVSMLDLLIGNDSGVRHVAVAFQVPVICIMGPTSPHYSSGPYERGLIVRVDVDCGPCQKPRCETDHRCMTQITVEQVVCAAKEMLRGAGCDARK